MKCKYRKLEEKLLKTLPIKRDTNKMIYSRFFSVFRG